MSELQTGSSGVTTIVGLLGGTRVAAVDEHGTVRPERALWSLEWWVGADDRWHLPTREAAVRQTRLDGMPVTRTSMRVPGGDAVHDVYGATAASVVVDIENASPAPFVVALVVRSAAHVALDGATVLIDGVPALSTPRPPSRWGVATDGSIADVVTGGHAQDGPMRAVRDRRATVDAAFLYPVAHRTRLRAAVALGRMDTGGVAGLDVGSVVPAEAVARGWRAQLGRGMRVTLPDPVVQAAVDSARAQLLLAGQAWRGSAAVFAALEDWGFDDEALHVWERLGLLDRRRARRMVPRATSWDAVRRASAGAPLAGIAAAELLADVRTLVAREPSDGVVELLPSWPTAWSGNDLDVRDVPTRRGLVSCSVRWHGDRPALLWDVPAGVEVRAPGLDPAWSSREPAGETLLGRRPPSR